MSLLVVVCSDGTLCLGEEVLVGIAGLKSHACRLISAQRMDVGEVQRCRS